MAGVVSAVVLERTAWLRKEWGQRSLVEILDEYQQRHSKPKESDKLKRRQYRPQ
ncbi:MAG: hypothetical protein GXY41_09505 [Phycisphaerae bacterium]|nr:hypothetical protein [Phycisphaerae bacterium]